MQVRKEPNSAELQSPGRQTRALLHPGAPCFAQPRAVWEHLQTPEPVVQTPWTRSALSAGWLTSHPYTAALWRATSSTSKLLILLSFHAAQSPNWFSSSSFPHVQPQTLQVQTNGGSLEGSKESTQRPAKHNLLGKKIAWKSWICLVWKSEGRRDLVAVSNYVKGCCKGCGNKLFCIPTGNRTRL